MALSDAAICRLGVRMPGSTDGWLKLTQRSADNQLAALVDYATDLEIITGGDQL